MVEVKRSNNINLFERTMESKLRFIYIYIYIFPLSGTFSSKFFSWHLCTLEIYYLKLTVVSVNKIVLNKGSRGKNTRKYGFFASLISRYQVYYLFYFWKIWVRQLKWDHISSHAEYVLCLLFASYFCESQITIQQSICSDLHGKWRHFHKRALNPERRCCVESSTSLFIKGSSTQGETRYKLEMLTLNIDLSLTLKHICTCSTVWRRTLKS